MRGRFGFPHHHGEEGLRVEVDDKNIPSGHPERGGKVHGSGRLPCSALMIANRQRDHSKGRLSRLQIELK